MRKMREKVVKNDEKLSPLVRELSYVKRKISPSWGKIKRGKINEKRHNNP
jgi:hypothetical protein